VIRVYLTSREAARLRDEHEDRWQALVDCFRSVDTEPVVVGSHDDAAVLESFLRWADMRRFARGAVP